MLVEPQAGDRTEDNLNPVGRIFYAGSALICVPHAIADGGQGTPALGAQAGRDRAGRGARAGGLLFGSPRGRDARSTSCWRPGRSGREQRTRAAGRLGETELTRRCGRLVEQRTRPCTVSGSAAGEQGLGEVALRVCGERDAARARDRPRSRPRGRRSLRPLVRPPRGRGQAVVRPSRRARLPARATIMRSAKGSSSGTTAAARSGSPTRRTPRRAARVRSGGCRRAACAQALGQPPRPAAPAPRCRRRARRGRARGRARYDRPAGEWIPRSQGPRSNPCNVSSTTWSVYWFAVSTRSALWSPTRVA